MKTRTTFVALLSALVFIIVGCATGTAFSEVSEGLDELDGAEVTTPGTVQRGVPVSGTDNYIYQFSDGEQTVAVLSTERPQSGDDREVTGRVVPYSPVTDRDDDLDEEAEEAQVEAVREAIESYLAESGVSEAALEAATDQSFGLVRTFTVANSATFFLLEQ